MKFVYSLLVGNKVLSRRQCRVVDLLQKLYDVGGMAGEFKIIGQEVDFPYGTDMMRFAMIEFIRESNDDELDYAMRRNRNAIEHGFRLQLDEELEDAIDNSGQAGDLIISYVQGPIWDSDNERSTVLEFAAELRKPFAMHRRLRQATALLEEVRPCLEHSLEFATLREDIQKFLDKGKKKHAEVSSQGETG